MLVPIHAGGISIGLEQQKEKKHNKLATGGSGKSSLVGTRLAFFPLQEICVRINHKYTQAQNTHTRGLHKQFDREHPDTQTYLYKESTRGTRNTSTSKCSPCSCCH